MTALRFCKGQAAVFTLVTVALFALAPRAASAAVTDCKGQPDGIECAPPCIVGGMCQNQLCVNGMVLKDGSPCASGDQCTVSDTCKVGVCTSGGQLVCPPKACNAAKCNPMLGCVYTPITCDMSPPPDGATPADLAVSDGGSGPDLAASGDLAGPDLAAADAARLPDLAAPPDLASDGSKPSDLTVRDLPGADLALLADLATDPEDLATPPADQAVDVDASRRLDAGAGQEELLHVHGSGCSCAVGARPGDGGSGAIALALLLLALLSGLALRRRSPPAASFPVDRARQDGPS